MYILTGPFTTHSISNSEGVEVVADHYYDIVAGSFRCVRPRECGSV